MFLGSWVVTGHKLTENTIRTEIGEEIKAALLIDAIENESGHSSSISLNNNLGQAFGKVNDQSLNSYRLSDADLESILRANLNKAFTIASINDVFSGDSEEEQFKRKAFNDYGNWLEGRDFVSEEDLRSNLQLVANNVEAYAIINQKGFNKYEIKDLKYRLSKRSATGPIAANPMLAFLLIYSLMIIGALLMIIPALKENPPGIRNNGIYFRSMTTVGWLGIFTGAVLILFYVVLYFYPEHMTPWIIMVDPISIAIKGSEAGRFFLYGFIYTLAILVMGVRMLIKYRGNKYQVFRTVSVMFFQTGFAFLIPEILLRLNQPYFDFKNIWPLDYDFFFETELSTLISSGSLGMFMLFWGVALIVVAVPVFVYFFGKRWYCSWVCGCGGLAETVGDPWRQLSNKSLKAWKIERWMVHAVLVFAVVMTAGVLYTYWTGQSRVAGIDTFRLREVYGAWIGAGFAGVVGTGFYPLMGNRVWCRFGCPLAAYLGLVQRFKSRFRITTNGGQCISCGNCSTYCEMGIDVRWYAQRGQNIIRSSCVGCGICSAVCPRGVLKLENGPEKGRFGTPSLPGNNSLIELPQIQK